MSHTLKRIFLTLGAGLLLAGSALAQAPANDNFINASVLPAALPASTTGSNIGATGELGESHYYSGSASVWWSWTPTASTPVVVDTIGSNFDTVLEVFEGTTLNTLTNLAVDDQGGTSGTSRLTFNAVAGHQYWIAVTGWSGNTGAISLQLAEGPGITSPLAADAALNAAFTYQITANNNPYSFYAYGLPYGIYYSSYTGLLSGTPYYTGRYEVSLYAYGSTTATATLILTVSDKYPVITSDGNVSPTQGEFFSYKITATKNPTHFYSSALPDGLVLDEFTGVISGTPTTPGYTSASIRAANDDGTGNAKLLYFQIASAAPAVGDYTLSATVGDTFSYQISATHNPTSFTADGLPPGVQFDPSTGVFSGKPRVTGFYAVDVTASNSYGPGYGTIYLSVYDSVSDDFAGRLPLVGNSIQRFITTDGASKEDGEPDHAGGSGTGSVWWTWTAPASAQYRVSVDSSVPFAVYTGNTLATLREVISNRDFGYGAPMTEVFMAVAGQRYQIALDTNYNLGAESTNFSLVKLAANTSDLLRVATTAGGTVTPGFLGTSFRPLGANCTITARAVPGYLFAGWTGSITSAEPRITFRMQSGISLLANFVPSPFTGLQGPYMGLISSNTDSPANSTTGLFKINLTVGGAFSGVVTYNNGAFPFHGVFGPDGTFTGIVVRPHQWPLTVSLGFDFTAAPPLLTGTISDDVSGSNITASRTTFNPKANPSAAAGAYTLTMTTDVQWAGNGFGLVRVSPAGAVRFIAVLPDGSRASQGGLLLDNAQWPLFASAHGGHGSISGVVTFEEIETSDFDGTLTWLRPPSRAAGPNAAGFTASLTLTGGSYAVPPMGTRALALQSGPGNLIFEADSPQSPTPEGQVYQKVATVLPNNVVPTRPTDPFDLTFNVKTGLFSGHYRNPETGARQPFGGVVRQGQDIGLGLWTARGALAGPVALVPFATANGSVSSIGVVTTTPVTTGGFTFSSGSDLTISSSFR